MYSSGVFLLAGSFFVFFFGAVSLTWGFDVPDRLYLFFRIVLLQSLFLLMMFSFVIPALFSFVRLPSFIFVSTQPLKKLTNGIWGMVIGGAAFYAIAVLFGAPIFDQALPTFLWSLFMSTLVFLPVSALSGFTLDTLSVILSYEINYSTFFLENNFHLSKRKNTEEALNLGTQNNMNTSMQKSPSYGDMHQKNLQTVLLFFVHLPALAAVVGAWLGAFVIPMDWDRPWQVFPIPCWYGAMVAYLLALLLGVLFGRVNFAQK